MSDISIEYSLNTPVFNDNNILNKKLFNMIANNNLQGGGFELGLSSCIVLLIGIIIIIFGIIILWNNNDMVETEGVIFKKSCSSNDSEGSECKVNIKYIVNSIQYSKIISIPKTNLSTSNTLKIYYSQSNPNLINLHNYNYSMIGVGSIIIGTITIFFSNN